MSLRKVYKGLWEDSSPSNLKGKKSGLGSRPSDVSTIGMMEHRSPHCPPT